jgi:hypothetical protein
MALVDQDPIITAQGQLREQMDAVNATLQQYLQHAQDVEGPQSFNGPAAVQNTLLAHDVAQAQAKVTARFEAAIQKLGGNVASAGDVDQQSAHDLSAVSGDLRYV